MKLLKELLSGIQNTDDQEDLSIEDEDLPPEEDIQPSEEEFFSQEDDIGEDDQELDQIANKSIEDPNKMGLIRTIIGAHLVYKRETEDGTFEELWFYTGGDAMKDELKIRKAIISGTDIPPSKTSSPDGKQSYVVWSVGNAEILQIKGLPN